MLDCWECDWLGRVDGWSSTVDDDCNGSGVVGASSIDSLSLATTSMSSSISVQLAATLPTPPPPPEEW